MRAYDQVDGPCIKWPLFSLLILVLAVIFLSEGTLAGGATRRVLILHSYNYTFPANIGRNENEL